MQYRAIINSSPYIMHFNKNHDKSNGQFTFGDGDGDGQTEYQDRIRKLDKMSDGKLYRTLKKEVHKQRGKVQGSGNNWMVLNPIGEHSKKLIDEKNKLEKQYEKSQKYKEWEKKVKKLDEEWSNLTDLGKYPEYEQRWDELMDQQPKKDFDTLYFVKIGKQYTDDYINKGGKELTMAYIKDLGFDDNKAKEYVDRLIKSGFTLGST